MLIQPLNTTKIGPKLWVLNAPMIIVVSGKTWRVPKGFVTDGASVPRLLWRIATPMSGAHAEAAVLHDWLYSLDCLIKLTHKEADAIFLEAMKVMGTTFVVRNTLFTGVDVFGGSSFRKRLSKDKLSDEGALY